VDSEASAAFSDVLFDCGLWSALEKTPLARQIESPKTTTRTTDPIAANFFIANLLLIQIVWLGIGVFIYRSLPVHKHPLLK
jgi:hypothetical protein